MTGDQTAQLVYALGCIVLVGSALLARRLEFGQVARMALAWMAIFAVGFAIFAFRQDISTLGGRLWNAVDPSAGTVVGQTLRVPMDSDGHFWVRGEVDGVSARFLVDSGATTTALSSRTIAAANIAPDGGFPVVINTANGAISAQRVRVGTLKIGPIIRDDFAAISAAEFGDTNILGMNFLSSLAGWGVEQNTLILRF